MSIGGSNSGSRPSRSSVTAPFCYPAGTAQTGTATTDAAFRRITIGVGTTVNEQDMLHQWACITLDSGAKEVRRISHVYPLSNQIFLEEALSGAATATAWTLIRHKDLPSDIHITNAGAADGTLLGVVFVAGQSVSYGDSNAVHPIYGDATGTTFTISEMKSSLISK